MLYDNAWIKPTNEKRICINQTIIQNARKAHPESKFWNIFLIALSHNNISENNFQLLSKCSKNDVSLGNKQAVK